MHKRRRSTAEFSSSVTAYPSNRCSCNNTQSFVSLEPSFRRLVGKLPVFIPHLLHTELHQTQRVRSHEIHEKSTNLGESCCSFCSGTYQYPVRPSTMLWGSWGIFTQTQTQTRTHVLLTPVLDGDRFWSSHSSRFTAGEKPPLLLGVGGMVVSLDGAKTRRISFLAVSRLSVFQVVRQACLIVEQFDSFLCVLMSCGDSD